MLVILIAFFSRREQNRAAARFLAQDASQQAQTASSRNASTSQVPGPSGVPSLPKRGPTAAETVTNKISQFSRNRRELVHAMARRDQIDVPTEVEEFFEAIEAGRWDEIEGLAKALHEALAGTEAIKLWHPIIEAWGAVQEAISWPPQKLLDYGNAVLGALRPGMVYVGGTDPGRWIPTLLTETSEGEHHIVLTQNAFADGSYLNYLDFLYGGRMASLTPEDSQRAFQDYRSDARQRLQHDQQFPDEPRQIPPGEDVSMVQNSVQFGGHTAVMAINERLLQTLMQKNPDSAFALEESSPLKGTYASAAPLGPIMELRAQGGQNALTADRATKALDYWRATTQQLLSDPEASNSLDTLRTYSHDATAQANLLASHNYNAEAEQAYNFASQLSPSNLEAVSGLSEILAKSGRTDQARQLLDDFARKNPAQRSEAETVRLRIFMKLPAPGPGR